ncbi:MULTISPECIES: helix-turn-helix transcriptional regulator [Raineya]|jgi:predicted DNA-binding transcriptional regulator YafY|uniref:WYL domain n=1 Tax=Raineya orbicola TaxID=2016530 RepID=A0A2N3IHW6_9BACT|nr:WYL domain-containing transcriptional regulator [Raineya orbicola]PKQ69922.1 WYL domain [Raineya orbicola]
MTFLSHLEILTTLIELLSRKGVYFSLPELAKKINLSERQTQRYINEIKSLGFEVKYYKRENGYQIDQDSTALLPATHKLLEASKIYQISQQDTSTSYIIFDRRQEVDAIFKELHEAIIKRFLVEITYQSFWAEEAFTTEIEPYLLKEFRNRWYVVAKNLYNEKIRTYALDRIQNFRLKAKKFTYPKDNPANLFQYCYGIFLPENPLQEPEELFLLFTHEQASYIESLPLHHSQKIIKKTNEGVLFSLKVHYTYDLAMELASMGESVRVLNKEEIQAKML